MHVHSSRLAGISRCFVAVEESAGRGGVPRAALLSSRLSLSLSFFSCENEWIFEGRPCVARGKGEFNGVSSSPLPEDEIRDSREKGSAGEGSAFLGRLENLN